MIIRRRSSSYRRHYLLFERDKLIAITQLFDDQARFFNNIIIRSVENRYNVQPRSSEFSVFEMASHACFFVQMPRTLEKIYAE